MTPNPCTKCGPTPTPPSTPLTISLAGQLFLTVAEFAELYRTDVRSVRRGIASGEIPAVQVGRLYRIPVPKVRELLGLGSADPEPDGAA